jgi:HEAT repeats
VEGTVVPFDENAWSSDSPEHDSAILHAIGAAFTRMTGRDYRKLIADREKIDECLHHPDPAYRGLALQFCARTWVPGPDSEERIFQMARLDPDEFVRSMAIMVLSFLDLAAGTTRFLTFFAKVALDEAEADLVRKAAYQSAVLCEPDLEKAAHIRKDKRYVITEVKVEDFDLAFIRSLHEG